MQQFKHTEEKTTGGLAVGVDAADADITETRCRCCCLARSEDNQPAVPVTPDNTLTE